MMKKIFFIAGALFFLSCCGRSVPTTFYLLDSGSKIVNFNDAVGRTLLLDRVHIPDYLDRNSLVCRVPGQSSLLVSDFHVWAEPLPSGVRRVIYERLFNPLLKKQIFVVSQHSGGSADYALDLDIQRMDGTPEGSVVLIVQWVVRNREKVSLGTGVFSAEEAVSVNDYEHLVRAESRLLCRFADFLSDRLPALLGGKA